MESVQVVDLICWNCQHLWNGLEILYAESLNESLFGPHKRKFWINFETTSILKVTTLFMSNIQGGVQKLVPLQPIIYKLNIGTVWNPVEIYDVGALSTFKVSDNTLRIMVEEDVWLIPHLDQTLIPSSLMHLNLFNLIPNFWKHRNFSLLFFELDVIINYFSGTCGNNYLVLVVTSGAHNFFILVNFVHKFSLVIIH